MMYAATTPATEGRWRMTTGQDTRSWFSECVEANMHALYGVALRLTGVGADAEDLVADSVLAARKAIDTLTERGRFRPWIFRILRNHRFPSAITIPPNRLASINT